MPTRAEWHRSANQIVAAREGMAPGSRRRRSRRKGLTMVIDCHVHVSALLPEHGLMSDRILNSLPFRFMQRRLGIRPQPGAEAATERVLTLRLFQLLDDTPELDAAAVLAFDAVYT